MKEKNQEFVSAIVVLYNPTEEVLANIRSYASEVDKIYCVDNSEIENSFVKEIKNMEYITLHKNTGIAYALNIGCEKAIDDGADVIVTFDQDTVCEKDTIHTLLATLKRTDTPVIVAPNIKYIYRNESTGERIFSDEKMFPISNEYVNWVITSGSMFRSSTFHLIGKFDARLFISQVDQDFCYRLKRNSGKVYRVGYAFIYQEPGNTKKKKIGNKIIHIPNQDKKRYYYLFRNEVYLRRKWGDSYKEFYVSRYKYIISILFFEKNKIQKLFACFNGSIKGKNM